MINSDKLRYNEIMEKNIGTILSTLIISFIIGTVAMIYNTDKSNEIVRTKLQFILFRINDLKSDISNMETEMKIRSKNRWTKNDQNIFEGKLEDKFKLIDHKIDRLENNNR
jgi:hypothetical protein